MNNFVIRNNNYREESFKDLMIDIIYIFIQSSKQCMYLISASILKLYIIDIYEIFNSFNSIIDPSYFIYLFFLFDKENTEIFKSMIYGSLEKKIQKIIVHGDFSKLS